MKRLTEAPVVRRLRRLRRSGPAEFVLVTMALACVLLPQWWAISRHRDQRRDELRVALSTTAETTARAADEWARRRVAAVRRIAREPEVRRLAERALAGEPQERDAGDLLAALQAAESSLDDGVRIDAFALLDADGRTVAAAGGGDASFDWEPARLAIAVSGTLIAWPDPATARPLLAASAPLAEQGGNEPSRPLLLVGFDAAGELAHLLRGRALGPSGQTRLYWWPERKSDGEWLAASDAGGDCPATPRALLAAASPVGDAVTERVLGHNLDGFTDCNGEQTVGAWAPLQGLPGGVISQLTLTEAYRSLAATRISLLGLLVSLGALMLVLVLLQTSPEEATSAPQRRNSAAWAILTVSLAATGVGWLSARARVDEHRQERVEEAAEMARSRLEERLAGYARLVETVHAARAAFAVQETGEWEDFIDGLDASRAFPALVCLGLGQLDGGRIEPLAGFACAESVEPARDCRLCRGAPVRELEALASSAGVTAVRWGPLTGTETGPGVVAMVLPASQPGVFVVAQIDFESLAGDIGRFAEVELAHRVGWFGPDGRLVTALASEAAAPADASTETRTLEFEVGAQRWAASFTPLPAPPSAIGQDYPAQLLLAGLAISVLLFDIALVLSSTRARALGIADLMTRRYRESESRTRAVIDSASDAILTFTARGAIDTGNPAAAQLFGYPPDGIAGVGIEDLLPICTPGEIARLAAHDPGAPGVECEGVRQDGTSFPVELTVSRLDGVERAVHVAIVRDISARRRAEERLRESEQRYALAARGANDGLWDWDLRTNRVYYSARWKAMLGFAESEIGDRPEEWLERVHSDDLLTLRSRLAEHLEGRAALFECEYRIMHRESGYRWVLTRGIAVREADGRATRVAGSQSDITERKRAERQLLYDALHDSLTGLPNRAYFINRIDQTRAEAGLGSRRLFGVLFLDIDRFKLVNDSLGHFVGDQLLVAFAERLKACLRPGDAICRLGGDEFAILVDHLASVGDATAIAERVQRELETPIHVAGHEMFTAVSIGIALSSTGRQTAEELLRDADIAMYRAKTRGKARYEVFHRGMHSRAVEMLEVETDLRRAIERGELTLFYQPIVDLADNRIRGCEALLRWQHPKRGLVLPGEFIGIAEESGAIVRITAWLLEQACAQNRLWRDAGWSDLYTSVNVSPKQLQQDGLAEIVRAALRGADLPADALQLECTENALIDSTEEAVEPLRELHAEGVHIALDDFGTGYSSLIHLKRFPLHAIKIDKSFVQRLPADAGNSAIASGLITMAHSLGLHVVAEGVETPEQAHFLREKNCDAIQGFLVSRPLPAEEFAGLLARGAGWAESVASTPR